MDARQKASVRLGDLASACCILAASLYRLTLDMHAQLPLSMIPWRSLRLVSASLEAPPCLSWYRLNSNESNPISPTALSELRANCGKGLCPCLPAARASGESHLNNIVIIKPATNPPGNPYLLPVCERRR